MKLPGEGFWKMVGRNASAVSEEGSCKKSGGTVRLKRQRERERERKSSYYSCSSEKVLVK